MKFLITVLLAAVVSACGNDDPAALVASAKEYMGKRDYNASVIQLKNALQKAPEHPEARYLLGAALLEQGDAVAAKIELDKAVELGFSSDELQVALARIELMTGGPAKMLEKFAGAKLAAPAAQAELLALVGIAQLARNERGAAQRAFEQALALDAANARANLGAARLAASERDFALALKRTERALAGAPAHLEALLFKADLLAVQGEPDAAEEAYRRAVASAPAQLAPRLSLVSHLLRQRALDKAAAEVAALEKAAPKDPRMFYAKALLLVEQRNFAAARETVQQVLKVAPEHVPALTLAGLAALETGALPEAESHLRKALFNAPSAFGAKRLLAMTHLRMGKTDAALAEAGELLKVSDDPAIVALAAEAHLASGDAAQATRLYEKAQALAPKNAALQTRLALIRLSLGDSERAVAELEAASAADPGAYQADLALVGSYLRRRDADGALEALKALEKKQPANPLTHNLRGGALMLKKDARGARQSFERALELQPGYMPAVANLAQLDLQEKKPEAARKRYEAVLKKEPNNEQALRGLAALLRVTGANRAEIEKPLKQAVAANPASPSARAALINFYLRERDVRAALGAAQEAHAALPNEAVLLQALGSTQLAAGETRQALSTLARLAEMRPKAYEPHILLAHAHIAAKQPDEAIKALRAALAIRPDLASAHRDIAGIYVGTGRPEQALREAKTVQAEQPRQPLGHVLEAEVYVAQKKWDLAERTYRSALKKFDTPALAVRTHVVMNLAGKSAAADALAEDWVRRHPKDTIVLGYLAERQLAAKRYDAAAKRYSAALEREPDNALFLNNLAWVSHQINDRRALELAERAHELAPDNATIMDTLGVILADSGQTERGLELLGRASELAPNAHQIRFNFAKALVKAQRKAAARKELEQLAKLDPKLPIQQEAAKLLAGL